MTLSSKQVAGAGAVLAFGLIAAFLSQGAAAYIAGVAVVGAVAIAVAGSGAGGAPLVGFVDAARRAASGDKLSTPAQATGESLRLYEALASVADERRKDRDGLAAIRSQMAEYESMLEESAQRLETNVDTQRSAADETSRLIKEMTGAIREIAQHVEALTHERRGCRARSSR